MAWKISKNTLGRLRLVFKFFLRCAMGQVTGYYLVYIKQGYPTIEKLERTPIRLFRKEDG